MAYPFGAWGPDQYKVDSDLAAEAKGVLPKAGSYGPWPSLQAIGAAVGAEVRGAYLARLSDGSTAVYAGTIDSLYEYTNLTTWTDVTDGGGYSNLPTGDHWSFAQFNNQLVACSYSNNPQVIDVDGAGTFGDLGGSPPKARYCQVVGDVLMLMDLATAQGSVAASGRIQAINSGFRKIDSWTIGKQSCDIHTFWDGGFVMGCTSLLAGLLFQERAIQRMVYTRGRRLLAFAPIQQDQGTDSPYSIVTHENTTFFSGTDGFCSIGPGGIQPIGDQWVDAWFLDTVNTGRLSVIVGALDPVQMRVFWLFPSSTISSNELDQVLCYDIHRKRWTHAEIDATYIFGGASPGQTLGEIAASYAKISLVPAPFGSRVWQGGAPGLAAFDTDQKLALFSGSALAATVQTGLFQPVENRRAYVNGFNPLTDADAAQARISAVERPQDDDSWSTAGDINAAGKVTRSAGGRYVRIEVTVPASESWNHLKGIDFDEDAGDLVSDGAD